MKSMIWKTIKLWLLAFTVLIGCTLLFVLVTGEILGLIIIPMMLGMLLIPITAVAAGVRAAKGKGSLWAAIVIAVFIGMFLFFFVTDGLRMMHSSEALVSPIPLLATLAGFGVGRMLEGHKVNADHRSHVTLKVGVVLLCCLGVYLIGALQSTLAYSFVPRELFFYRPANNFTNVSIENDDNRLLGADAQPFTGAIKSYQERLIINPSPKKVSGLAYYIDGYLFGESGDVVPPGRYSSWYGSYQGTESWLVNDPANIERETQIFLHKDYSRILENELAGGEVLYYQERDDEWRQTVILVMANEDRLERKEIFFYPNGVVSGIITYPCTAEGWDLSWNSIYFDELGYRDDIETDIQWNEADFALTSINSYELVQRYRVNKNSEFQRVESMVYVPSPENWNHDNLMDNLLAVHDIPLETVYFYVDDQQGTWQSLDSEDGTILFDWMDKSSVILEFLEDDQHIWDFQSEAVEFKIEAADATRAVYLYYKDGRLLVNNGPYYLDLNNGNASGAEEGFLAVIEKYTGTSS